LLSIEDVYGFYFIQFIIYTNIMDLSDVLAQLGLKAAALAWLLTAWTFKICVMDIGYLSIYSFLFIYT
jgi:hypothetical protein